MNKYPPQGHRVPCYAPQPSNIKEFKMQYTCPKCGAIGGGADNTHYFCHVCPTYELMLPSNNGKIYPQYLRLGELKEVKPEPKTVTIEKWLLSNKESNDVWIWHGNSSYFSNLPSRMQKIKLLESYEVVLP